MTQANTLPQVFDAAKQILGNVDSNLLQPPKELTNATREAAKFIAGALGDINQLFDKLETAANALSGTIQPLEQLQSIIGGQPASPPSGTLAQRPSAASSTNKIYYNTDDKLSYSSNGTTWAALSNPNQDNKWTQIKTTAQSLLAQLQPYATDATAQQITVVVQTAIPVLDALIALEASRNAKMLAAQIMALASGLVNPEIIAALAAKTAATQIISTARSALTAAATATNEVTR